MSGPIWVSWSVPADEGAIVGERLANSSATVSWTMKRLAACRPRPCCAAWRAWRRRPRVEVGVLEHEERGVPAEFHRGAQDLLGGLLSRPPADRGGAGEGELPQPGALEHRPGPGRASGGDDVEHAGRQADLLEHRMSARVGQGREVGGLEDHGAAAAIAGAILRVAIASGKFHGVMNSDGPDRRL